MSDKPRDPTKRLEPALRSYSMSQMKAVRAEVQGELQILNAAQAKEPAPPPPEPSPGPAQLEPSVMLRASDIQDLQKASKIASDFMTGMDRIADVLMLLVMKFGRASTLMRAVFIGNFIAVILLIGMIVAVWNLITQQSAIQEKQGEIQEQQTKILARQSATQRVAGEAKQQAAAAAQKVDNAPEITVDSKGRPQIILKVPDPSTPDKTTTQVIRLPTQQR